MPESVLRLVRVPISSPVMHEYKRRRKGSLPLLLRELHVLLPENSMVLAYELVVSAQDWYIVQTL